MDIFSHLFLILLYIVMMLQCYMMAHCDVYKLPASFFGFDMAKPQVEKRKNAAHVSN